MSSCSINKDIISLKFKGYSNSKKEKYSYNINLPKGYVLKEILGGNEWTEKQCVYPDGSIIYINNEGGAPSINYKNIENDKEAMKKSLEVISDTLTLYGIDNEGKYWKNLKKDDINFGYLNVTNEKKKEFDKILSTLK